MSCKDHSDADFQFEFEVNGKIRNQVSDLIRLSRLILDHRLILALGLFAVTIVIGSTLLEPRLFAYAIDDGIIPKRWDHLKWIGSLFFAVTTLRVIAVAQQGYLFEVLGQRVTQDLRILLFSHLQRMPVAIFDQYPTGRLLTRVTNDVAALSEMFSAGFVSMLCNILLILGIFIGLMALNIRLGLIGCSVFPFLVLASIYFSKLLRIAYRESRAKLSALNGFLAENLAGMKIVQLFNRQKLHLHRFETLNQAYANAQTQSIRVFAHFQPTITVTAGVSIGLIIWFGGTQAIAGNLKLGVLVAYFSYILALFQPIREIADKWNIFLSGMASVERVFSLLDCPTEFEAELALGSVPPIENHGHIVFDKVWFAYQGESWILKDFSFEIKAGERIGVVGHTGAGKTTLVSLLMRFYEPQRGRILLDGKDLREFSKRALRASIGIVQQDVFLFSGSFQDNITFWMQADREKIEQLMAKLGLSHLSEERVNERGTNFSGGERQMIAFARALLIQPKIWILDEASAHLDSETEAALQRSLITASQSRTTILIAHRLATIRSADRILVLNQGSLVESGSHAELMNQNGFYARLYRYQSVQQAQSGVEDVSQSHRPEVNL